MLIDDKECRLLYKVQRAKEQDVMIITGKVEVHGEPANSFDKEQLQVLQDLDEKEIDTPSVITKKCLIADLTCSFLKDLQN